MPSTLIIEDGTVVANADSYATAAEATTYHAARGNATWAALSETAKDQALRKASDYMGQTYRARWLGSRAVATQALDWPRSGVPIADAVLVAYVPYNTIPVEVKTAQILLALISLTTELAPNMDRVILSETIGPIKTDFDKNSVQYTQFRTVDNTLRIYLCDFGASTRLVRR